MRRYERATLLLGTLFYATLLGLSFVPRLSLDADDCGRGKGLTLQALLRAYASLELVLLLLLAAVHWLEERQRGGPHDRYARVCHWRNATPYLGTYFLLFLHVMSSIACAVMLWAASAVEWSCGSWPSLPAFCLVIAAAVLPAGGWLLLLVCGCRGQPLPQPYVYVLPE